MVLRKVFFAAPDSLIDGLTNNENVKSVAL